MNKTNTIGVDLAKNIFHLHIQDEKGHFIKKLKLDPIGYFLLPIIRYSQSNDNSCFVHHLHFE
ncbi:hypothetical protein LCGC14_0471000 [marine sediment metagenome]|uniref:Uncharacterized protein n=1 Tax=marine sediment metagenome TaxID=412755 RepID=A0A0F9SCA2_9ZZZZ